MALFFGHFKLPEEIENILLCSQVDKFKEDADTLSNKLKNMEDHIEKVIINRSDIGFIAIVELVFRPILNENVIPIPLILYAMY
jgi:hypothetical protein